MEVLEKMKKTKYSWITSIPENWDLIRIKYLYNEIVDLSQSGDEELLSVSNYTGVRPKTESISEEGDNLTNAASLVGYKLVKKGDLVINIMLAWNASLGVSDFDGIVSPAYCVYRLKDLENNNPRFFNYLFKTEKYKAVFKRNSTGIIDSRLRLYTDKFFSIPAIVPSIEEQNDIVAYLEQKLSAIDELISRNEIIFGKSDRKTGLLQDYKKSLIEETVLGIMSINKKTGNN